MAALCSVNLHGRPITRREMIRHIGDVSLCPIEFDVARALSREDANTLSAWLRRKGMDVSIVTIAAHGGGGSGRRKLRAGTVDT